MRRSGSPASIFAVLVALAATGTAEAANGEQVYVENCAACHQPDGSGVPGLAPPLRGELWKRLGGRSAAYLAGVLVSGMVGVPLDGQRFGAAMPPWAHLSDPELAAVGSYVLQKLNGGKAGLGVAAVKEARKASPDVTALKKLREGGA
jgi:mono/diheme cytochrome c family protein